MHCTVRDSIYRIYYNMLANNTALILCYIRINILVVQLVIFYKNKYIICFKGEIKIGKEIR